eukprot:gene12520-3205_t
MTGEIKVQQGQTILSYGEYKQCFKIIRKYKLIEETREGAAMEIKRTQSSVSGDSVKIRANKCWDILRQTVLSTYITSKITSSELAVWRTTQHEAKEEEQKLKFMLNKTVEAARKTLEKVELKADRVSANYMEYFSDLKLKITISEHSKNIEKAFAEGSWQRDRKTSVTKFASGFGLVRQMEANHDRIMARRKQLSKITIQKTTQADKNTKVETTTWASELKGKRSTRRRTSENKKRHKQQRLQLKNISKGKNPEENEELEDCNSKISNVQRTYKRDIRCSTLGGKDVESNYFNRKRNNKLFQSNSGEERYYNTKTGETAMSKTALSCLAEVTDDDDEDERGENPCGGLPQNTETDINNVEQENTQRRLNSRTRISEKVNRFLNNCKNYNEVAVSMQKINDTPTSPNSHINKGTKEHCMPSFGMSYTRKGTLSTIDDESDGETNKSQLSSSYLVEDENSSPQDTMIIKKMSPKEKRQAMQTVGDISVQSESEMQLQCAKDRLDMFFDSQDSYEVINSRKIEPRKSSQKPLKPFLKRDSGYFDTTMSSVTVASTWGTRDKKRNITEIADALREHGHEKKASEFEEALALIKAAQQEMRRRLNATRIMIEEEKRKLKLVEQERLKIKDMKITYERLKEIEKERRKQEELKRAQREEAERRRQANLQLHKERQLLAIENSKGKSPSEISTTLVDTRTSFQKLAEVRFFMCTLEHVCVFAGERLFEMKQKQQNETKSNDRRTEDEKSRAERNKTVAFSGQDRTGQDRTGQDRTGQDRTGQDRTGQDRTGQDRTGQDRTGQDRTGQHRTGHRTTQDNTGQDRTGQDRTGQDRTGQDRTGQDRTGQDRTKQNRLCLHDFST